MALHIEVADPALFEGVESPWLCIEEPDGDMLFVINSAAGRFAMSDHAAEVVSAMIATRLRVVS